MYKVFYVEAENLQEAVTKAFKEFFKSPGEDGEYIEDSFEIDSIVSDDYFDEEYNEREALALADEPDTEKDPTSIQDL
jgi:hypothetical protein